MVATIEGYNPVGLSVALAVTAFDRALGKGNNMEHHALGRGVGGDG